MDLIRRLFRRGGAPDAAATQPDREPADSKFPEQPRVVRGDWDSRKQWERNVDENALKYVDPFPFTDLSADLRRKVLEFTLGASWSGMHEERPRNWHPRSVNYKPPVLFSAVASLRTLTFHARSIKAVCTTVATDVRVLEKTVAKPSAWLQGLWHVDTAQLTPEPLALIRCRSRAIAAGRANYVAQLFSRLEVYATVPDYSFQCPHGWSTGRAQGAEHLYDRIIYDEEEKSDRTLAWAHARVRPPGQEEGLAAVDHDFMKSCCCSAFDGFVARFSQNTWTLLVHDVKLVRRGIAGGNMSQAVDVDVLEANLAAFFGAERMQSPPWCSAWCNRSHHPYGARFGFGGMGYLTSIGKHDRSEPPITRMRDVKDSDGQPALQTCYDFELTVDGRKTPKPLMLSAATIDLNIHLAHSAPQTTYESDGEDLPPLHTPPYMWIGEVYGAKCRTGSTTYGGPSTMFKLRTEDLCKPQILDEAVLIVPIVPDVFDVVCGCTVVGLC